MKKKFISTLLMVGILLSLIMAGTITARANTISTDIHDIKPIAVSSDGVTTSSNSSLIDTYANRYRTAFFILGREGYTWDTESVTYNVKEYVSFTGTIASSITGVEGYDYSYSTIKIYADHNEIFTSKEFCADGSTQPQNFNINLRGINIIKIEYILRSAPLSQGEKIVRSATIYNGAFHEPKFRYTTADALDILKIAAGVVSFDTITEEQVEKFDVDIDGEITTADALLALRFAAGLY